MELPVRVLEDERQKVAVPFPHGQIEDLRELNPFERPLGVLDLRRAVRAVDAEDEAEPILAALAEAGPADRAAQTQGGALHPRLLPALTPHAGQLVLARLELAPPT